MKDDKEDDTVRYKNTLDSHDNSLSNNINNTSDSKNIRIKTREENKNIIDKLYDCGDELSLEDANFQLNNEFSNNISPTKENSNKKEKYNMNMFKFVDTEDYLESNNNNNKKNIKKKINRKEKKEKENYFGNGNNLITNFMMDYNKINGGNNQIKEKNEFVKKK